MEYKVIGHGSLGYVLSFNGDKYLTKIFFDCNRPCHDINYIIKKNLENNRILLGLGRKDIGLEMEEIELKEVPKIDDCDNIGLKALKMEKINGLNLKQFLLNGDFKSLSYEQVKNAIDYNLQTIGLLHKKGYVHLDIRMENIMVVEEYFRIIDYDFMSKIESEEALNIGLANEFYPPEHKYLARKKLTNEGGMMVYSKIIRYYWKTIEEEINQLVDNSDIFREFEEKMKEKYNGKCMKEVLCKVARENYGYIEEVIGRDYREILENVDYFMYGLAMYIFLSRVKETVPEGKRSEWDGLIERLIGMIDIGYKERKI